MCYVLVAVLVWCLYTQRTGVVNALGMGIIRGVQCSHAATGRWNLVHLLNMKKFKWVPIGTATEYHCFKED
jgi:hypothetical protein